MTTRSTDRRLARLVYGLAVLLELVLLLPALAVCVLVAQRMAGVHPLAYPPVLPASATGMALTALGGMLAALVLPAALQELARRIEVRHWTTPTPSGEDTRA